MTRALTVVALLVMLLALYGLMYASWSRRRRRHPGAAVASATDQVRPGVAGAEPGPGDAAVTAEGTYVSTVSAESSFDRVTAGGLGARSRARMTVDGPEVCWEREGAPAVRVGAQRVLGARRSPGMAGKVTGRPLLVAVTWCGEDGASYETGFLPRYRKDTDQLLSALDRLVPRPGSPGPTEPSSTPAGPASPASPASPAAEATANPDGST